MTTIKDILFPEHLQLDLSAATAAGAIHQIAELLRGDERVSDWNKFCGNLKTGNACLTNESGYGICIPHARTAAVSSMVAAAGRSASGIVFDNEGLRVHYIFVIGVPAPLASDYLRIIGALARTFRSLKCEAALRTAATQEEFLEVLAASEISA